MRIRVDGLGLDSINAPAFGGTLKGLRGHGLTPFSPRTIRSEVHDWAKLVGGLLGRLSKLEEAKD